MIADSPTIIRHTRKPRFRTDLTLRLGQPSGWHRAIVRVTTMASPNTNVQPTRASRYQGPWREALNKVALNTTKKNQPLPLPLPQKKNLLFHLISHTSRETRHHNKYILPSRASSVPRALAGGAEQGSAPPATDWHLFAVLEISSSACKSSRAKLRSVQDVPVSAILNSKSVKFWGQFR